MAIRPPLTESRQDIWNHFLMNPVKVTSDYTAGLNQVILGDGTFTITLPEASEAFHTYVIKNIGSGTITIAASDGDLLEGAVSTTTQASLVAGHWASDGETNWWLVGIYP